MLKDIHFKFRGFHGSPGHCHIRFAKLGNDRPLVIVCSQYRNYYGTSVTNGIEIIAKSLFNNIVNRQIADVTFDRPIPVRVEWHSDANFFDKFLARTFPSKYHERFSTAHLDLPAIFSTIIWIEHYPINHNAYSFQKQYTVVTLQEQGTPSWHGRPSENWLIDKTGFRVDELLPQDEVLDLEIYEQKVETIPHSEVELQSFPGYYQVRWTQMLLTHLPGLLSAARARRGLDDSADLDEYAVHGEIHQFLAVQLPAGELLRKDYPFSKELGIYEGGKEKEVDFAIFSPEKNRLDSIIEVKRTSSKSSSLVAEVKKDIARLLFLSHRFNCSCYLLICGETEKIRENVEKLSEYLSLSDDETERNCDFSLTYSNFSLEYGRLLKDTNLNRGSTRFQGKNESGSNSTMLWQVAEDMETLQTHRPYEFNLGKVTRR